MNKFNVCFIESWNEKGQLAATGITRPVIIECLGSNGKMHRQLVKPQDDLRQDAIMEQVFSLVNGLLSQSQPTKQRNLHIRTYKVIPLTPSVGIVEWVMHTIPIGIYLNDTHNKFMRPNDIDHMT